MSESALGIEIPEKVVHAYIINVLADEYDTQRQLLDSGNVVTKLHIDSPISARYERLQTERSEAGSFAREACFKEAASVQQNGQLCQKSGHMVRARRSFECKQVPFSGNCTF